MLSVCGKPNSASRTVALIFKGATGDIKSRIKPRGCHAKILSVLTTQGYRGSDPSGSCFIAFQQASKKFAEFSTEDSSEKVELQFIMSNRHVRAASRPLHYTLNYPITLFVCVD